MERYSPSQILAANARILKIPKPKLRYSNIGTRYTTLDNTLWYKRAEDTFTMVLAISHECRHAWQWKYHPEMLDGYKTREELDLVDYNMQQAELDANAWATRVCIGTLGLKPLFKGLPANVVEEIYRHAETI